MLVVGLWTSNISGNIYRGRCGPLSPCMGSLFVATSPPFTHSMGATQTLPGEFCFKWAQDLGMAFQFDNFRLYHHKGAGMDVYVPLTGAGQMRHLNRWTCMDIDQPRCDLGSICIMHNIPNNEKAIVCYAEGPPRAPTPSSFWEVLCKKQCTWMWDNLQWVGNDDWLAMPLPMERV
jgi:hypothetical protein